MFGVLRTASPGMFGRLPARSELSVSRRKQGPVRYYELFLRPGRDGEAARLLAEQTAPFIGERPLVIGRCPEGVRPFSARAFERRVLLASALRLTVYRGGKVGIIEPSGERTEAEKFAPYAEVAVIRAGEPPDAFDDCSLIISFSGLAGVSLPENGFPNAVIFTDNPSPFSGGAVIDGFLPRIPDALLPPVDGLDPGLYAAACWELCGMSGLCALPPRRLLSHGKPVAAEKLGL